MNYDRFGLKRMFGAQMNNFCRQIIIDKMGHKAYDIDLDGESWSMADSALESVQEQIEFHLDQNIPNRKG